VTAYCTPQDLIDRFGQAEVAQLSPSLLGQVDTAKVQRACDDAGDLVDGYLRPRYALPLSAVPSLLVKLSATIARFELHLGGDRQPTDQVRKDRDDAIAFLKDVAAKKADLGLDGTGEEPAEDASTSASVRFKSGSTGLIEGDLAHYRWGGPL
jgi:phage gp36-like protein